MHGDHGTHRWSPADNIASVGPWPVKETSKGHRGPMTVALTIGHPLTTPHHQRWSLSLEE